MSQATHVTGPLVRRGIGLDSFADITEVPVAAITRDAITFGGVLTEEQVDAVWWRISSRDDDDEARRRALHAAVADHDDPVLVALVRYVLGLPEGD